MKKSTNLSIPERIILASASPRRSELLRSIGLPFEAIHPAVDEKELDVSRLPPKSQVIALARFKGESIAQSHPDAVVIAADTIVAINNQILGKPQDEEDAFRMLSILQDMTHSVFSGIALFYQGEVITDALETKVRMAPLTMDAIYRYIETKEPMDKAGAYAIQGVGSTLIEEIHGCYFNVVGLPMNLLHQLFEQLGFQLVL